MPFSTAPNLIEQTDFTFGWAADGESAHRGPTELEDVLNLLVEEATGAMRTRLGFNRTAKPITAGASRYIVSLHVYRGRHDFIVVTTNGASGENNVRIFYVDTSTWTATRIDPVDVEWAHPKQPHWGMVIDDVYYGGTTGDPMYSYDAGTSTFDADATSNNYKSVVSTTGAGVDTATEYGRDFAWTGKERVEYSSDFFTPNRSIRYDSWDDDNRYSRGDKVTRKTDDYAKSYRCIKAHDSQTAATIPDTGADWKTYWKRITLPLPRDADGETSDKWDFLLQAPQSKIAAWFGNRLWLKSNDQGDRMMFSAPLHAEHNEDIPDTTFDPRNFAPGNDLKGPGGGWLDFGDGMQDFNIKAVREYQQYLIVWKGKNTWVLSGASEEDFTIRRLEHGVGCNSPVGHIEHQGLVYFLDDHGLYVTDGTQVQPVPGSEKVRSWFTQRQDQTEEDDETYFPKVFSWGDYVGVSLPVIDDDTENRDYITVFYHPPTGSFWKTDLPILDSNKLTIQGDGTQKFYFVTPQEYGLDFIYEYTGTTDDSGAGDVADDENPADIAWTARTSWWPFGVAHTERRIRRIWAIIKGAQTYTLQAWKDWNYDANDPEIDVDQAVAVSYPSYIEGRWFPDSHAVMFEVSGTEAPAVVHGIAVDTEPRRRRYHA